MTAENTTTTEQDTTNQSSETTQAPESSELHEDEILFPEAEVDGIIIKPWSFGTLFEVAQDLEIVLKKLEESDINIDQLNLYDYKSMVRIFSIAGPHVFKIMSKTLAMDEPKLKNDLSVQTGIKIAVVIVRQNLEQIKNGFGLV